MVNQSSVQVDVHLNAEPFIQEFRLLQARIWRIKHPVLSFLFAPFISYWLWRNKPMWKPDEGRDGRIVMLTPMLDLPDGYFKILSQDLMKKNESFGG